MREFVNEAEKRTKFQCNQLFEKAIDNLPEGPGQAPEGPGQAREGSPTS